jgi:hypothetical protein
MPYSGAERTAQIVVTGAPIPGEYSLKVKVLAPKEEKKPVAGAAVKVSNAVSKEETTDGEGVADFGKLAGGDYTITISAAGYKDYKDTITLDADTVYEAVLEPAPIPILVWTLAPLVFGLAITTSSR